MPRPAPSKPARLPVEALTLTRSAGRSSRSAIGGRHLVEAAGEPRPRRHDGQVDGHGREAGRPDPLEARRRAAPARRSRPASPARPGRGARGRRGRPPRAARRRRRGGRRHRRSGRGGAVRPRSRCRRGPAAPPGPNGWPSSPNPTRTAGGGGPRASPRATSAASTRARSSGSVTLRFVDSPGTAWTGILQASSREASSVHVAEPPGGCCGPGAGQDVPADPLRRLGGGEGRAVDGRRRRGRPRSA